MKKPISSSHDRESRRRFLQGSSLAAISLPVTLFASQDNSPAMPSAFAPLKPLGSRVKPITNDEFRARIARAQQLMAEASPKFEALFVAPGTSLYYFSGIRWWPSERLLALLIPRTGDPILICAGFEEGRLREQLRFPAEVRVWQEDESPTKLAAQALSDRGIRTGRIGVDETAYFTFFDHMRAAAPSLEFASGDPITIGCRAVKSAHELELMRLSSEATCDVFRAVFASLREGMTQSEVSQLVEAGYSKMGLRGDALVLFGASAALPHGSIKPQSLKEGDVVLIDGGCKLEGYDSDITRTAVFGKPTGKMRKVYDIVRGAQGAALDAARAGKLSGAVDDAARAVITAGGFGPDYKFFTHRLGHGIGLDGHEHPYLVRGSKTVLAPGMTFSNEPGIYIPGEFGIRCEDDMVIMADGPAQILSPSFQNSLEKPFA
ncbi:MAG: aminopeptidase P family protein [Acidobacteria bacterium]|nr:aminopeptidase P family protein [Acidobacteriota bacterium]MBS1867299.1 aminopeptidase P family protein [Acidobacteriota bacterium]